MSHERRVFLELTPESAKEGSEVSLPQPIAHHLFSVLRLSPGNVVVVVDTKSGQSFEAVIASLPPTPSLKLVRVTTNTHETFGPVSTLIFALGKNPVNDLVCEKACELGVRTLIFWQAERSIISLDEADRAKKISRWRTISESAAKQSGKGALMEIALALSIKELLGSLEALSTPTDRKICCSLSQEAIPLQDLPPLSTPCHVVVGPAGDLAPKEEDTLVQNGFERASLGSFLLRSETAAIAGVAMIHALWNSDGSAKVAA